MCPLLRCKNFYRKINTPISLICWLAVVSEAFLHHIPDSTSYYDLVDTWSDSVCIPQVIFHPRSKAAHITMDNTHLRSLHFVLCADMPTRLLLNPYQEVCDHLPQFTPFYCHSHFHSIGKLVCKHTFSFCNFLFSYIINYCTLDTYSIGLKDQFDIIFVMVHWKLSLPIC